MSYSRSVALTWALALLLALLLAYDLAHAGELFLDMAAGASRFLVTTPDGDYQQKDLPHSFDLKSAAYRIGLGWRFNDRWSIQGGYINLGTVNQSAVFVPDEFFDPKAGKCINGCQRKANYRITDAYHGGELTVARTWHPTEDYSLFLKAGWAYLMHRFTINKEDGSGQANQHYGQFPATVAGIGACYKWACAETTYYHGLGGSNGFMGQDQGWPLSKEIVLFTAGLQIPIW